HVSTPSNSILAQTISPTARPQGIAIPTDGSRSTSPVVKVQGAAALHTRPAQVRVPTAIQGHPPQALLRSRRNRYSGTAARYLPRGAAAAHHTAHHGRPQFTRALPTSSNPSQAQMSRAIAQGGQAGLKRGNAKSPRLHKA